MPTFDVSIRGRTYHVEISDPGAMPLRVVVDGEAFEVGIVGTEIGLRPPPITEAPLPAPQPPPLPAPPLPALPRLNGPRPAAPAGGYSAGGAVTAPMPGTILSVAVSVGQHVEAGQVVCVLEAMKMKNPIRTTHSGTVAEVAVGDGQTVAYGDPLLRLE